MATHDDGDVLMVAVTPSRSGRQAGFTLVELIIGMVLAGVLLAFAGGFLINAFSGEQKSINERRAIESVNNTIAQFGDDVRRVQSPDRDPSKLTSDTMLQEALLRDQGVVGGSTLQLDVRDIVEATATSFAVRADVLPDIVYGPDECIRYYVPAANPGLVREVWNRSQPAPATGCGGTGARLLESKVLIQRVG